jgi:hypothetical protein
MSHALAARRLTPVRVDLVAIAVAAVLGSLMTGAQSAAVAGWSIALLVCAVVGYLWIRYSAVDLWQVLVMTAVTGYVVLNYGFANLSLSGAGLPLMAGHGLMFLALGLALTGKRGAASRVLEDPAIWGILAVILISALHLVWDMKQYGLYALRDASVFVEAIFVLLGMVWAMDARRIALFGRWLLILFAANFFYSLTAPWAETVSAHSPVSGVFLSVPLFGIYAGNSVYLLAGAFFCLGPARHLVRWPRWLLLSLAVGQLFGLAIYQHRSLYVSLMVGLFLLVLCGEIVQFTRILVAFFCALLVLLLLTSVAGVALQGRVGQVSLDFLENHLESLLLKPGTPAVGTLYDREKWYGEAWQRITASPQTLVIGEGFGTPLINFRVKHGVQVRQPHNVILTVFARIGLVGLLCWTAMNLYIVARFVIGLRRRRHAVPLFSDLVVWLLMFYVFSMMTTMVQPWLEFSYGAVPFYVLLGFALGLIRWQVGAAPERPLAV